MKLTNEDALKTSRMLVAINKFKECKGIGTFKHPPRFGKTYETILLLKTIRGSKNYEVAPIKSILIVVPGQIVKSQWEKEIEDYFPDADNIFVRTIDSISYEFIDNIPFYISVFDEIHKYMADTYYEKINNIQTIFKLGLTGTLPDKEKYKNRMNQFCPVIDEINEEEAILKNWISKYKEYNVALKLNENDKLLYMQYSSKITDLMKKYSHDYQRFLNGTENVFEGDLDLILSCLSGKKMFGQDIKAFAIRNAIARIHGWNVDLNLFDPKLREIHDMYNPDAIFHDAKVLRNMVTLRTAILSNNVEKLKAVIELSKLDLGKTLIFNDSTDFANKIGESLNRSLVYHSYIKAIPIKGCDGEFIKMKSKDEIKLFGKKALKDMIPNLLETQIDYLVTAKALDEGFNAPSISTVIITAGSLSPSKHTQRSARGKTINFDNPNKRVTIINLYFDDFILPDGTLVSSRDKEKLKRRQTLVNSPIECKSVEEFKILHFQSDCQTE